MSKLHRRALSISRVKWETVRGPSGKVDKERSLKLVQTLDKSLFLLKVAR